MENENELLNSIEKYVFEEDKIVTYKSLSKWQNIHVNISKRLLSSFICKTNEKIAVCYLIGGVLADGSYKIIVCWQQECSDVKRRFKTITSEHVYSIQKNVQNGDLKVLLYSADSASDEGGTTQTCSSIKFEGSVLRDTSAVEELKRQALIAAKSKSSESTPKVKTFGGKKQPEVSKKENTSENDANEPSATSGTKKNESNSPKKTSSPKKTGIAAMFAAKKDNKKTENQVKVQQPSKSKPKGLNAFFNQNGGNKKPTKTKEDIIKDVSPEKDKENRKTEEIVKEKSKPIEKSEEKKENKSETISTTKETKSSNKTKPVKKGGNKRKKSKEEDGSAKKRKRIMLMSDSESSDEDGYRSPSPEQREPTPPPPVSDDEDVVPTTPQVGKKSKKRKLVEKTFMDNDGFLVTNKEYVLASDSEDEPMNSKATLEKSKEVQESAKEEKAKEQASKKKISPQKVKQASIMNFFKKS